MTTEQENAVAYIRRQHIGCPTITRKGRHGYVELDVITRERAKVYEISPDGHYSRSI